MSFEESLPLVVRKYLEAYNQRDVAALADCVSADVSFENVSNSAPALAVHGRQAFIDLAAQGASVFTERHQRVRTAVIEAGAVAVEVDWSGVPSVDLGPMKAGVRAQMRGASFFKITDGKLSKIVDLS